MGSTSRHTRGPFYVHRDELNKGHSVDLNIYAKTSSGCPKYVARVYGEGVLCSIVAERDANADLLAAAPDLLEAAERIANIAGLAAARGKVSVDLGIGIGSAIGLLCDAIAKAKGED